MLDRGKERQIEGGDHRGLRGGNTAWLCFTFTLVFMFVSIPIQHLVSLATTGTGGGGDKTAVLE